MNDSHAKLPPFRGGPYLDSPTLEGVGGKEWKQGVKLGKSASHNGGLYELGNAQKHMEMIDK